MHFGGKPRFELFPDGTIITRAGTQTNCGGIAQLLVRITANASGVLTIGPDTNNEWTLDQYGMAPGYAIPAVYREAVLQGAQKAYVQHVADIGLHIELIEALIHPVDSRVSKFEQVGFQAVEGWAATMIRTDRIP